MAVGITGEKKGLRWGCRKVESAPIRPSRQGLTRAFRQGKGQSAVVKRMRILLQQTETGLYFKDIEVWTRNPSEAVDFLSSTSATEFCLTNKLSGVVLVLKFEENPYEIVMPVVPEAAQTSRASSRI